MNTSAMTLRRTQDGISPWQSLCFNASMMTAWACVTAASNRWLQTLQQHRGLMTQWQRSQARLSYLIFSIMFGETHSKESKQIKLMPCKL